MKRKNKEYQLCKAISKYMRLQYPHAIYHFDYAGLNLSIAQAGMMKEIQGERGYPDMFIAEPRGQYHGLFLEIKDKDAKVFKKDGSLYADPHLDEQSNMLVKLSLKGYRARFVLGFDAFKEEVDKYMNLPTS